VLEGVDQLLYSLLVLGCVTDSRGMVWLRSPFDLYLIETMPLKDRDTQVSVHLLFEKFSDHPNMIISGTFIEEFIAFVCRCVTLLMAVIDL
jgi:ligand-binding sensor domain-containing protein